MIDIRTGDEAVDAFLWTLYFVPNLFVTGIILEKRDDVVFPNDDIDHYDIESDLVTFFSNDKDINTIDLNNISIEHDYFHEDDPETTIHVISACYNRYKQNKACKNEISKWLMPVTWHPTR